MEDVMTIGLVLLVIVVILIPIMLFVKPCCFRGDPGHENEGEVEFANIQNMEQQNQGIQNNSEKRDVTEDAMIKRQDEMKQLEMQI